MKKWRISVNKHIFSLLVLITLCQHSLASKMENSDMENLPNYVSIKDPREHSEILRQPATEMTFPLSEEDREIIRILESKFDAEENCAGLAAPQIGFRKKAIVFAIEATEELKKWRPDLTEGMPKSIWINPSYKSVGEDTCEDFEASFSVEGMAGKVRRFNRISYQAYLHDGSKVEGEVSGFLARLIQHEIDHTNGRLFVDLVPEGQLFTMEEYRKMRAAKMDAAGE